MDTTKLCPKCGEIKATNDFARNRARYDGRNNYCKMCESVRQQALKLANPAKYAEKSRNYSQRYRQSDKFKVAPYSPEKYVERHAARPDKIRANNAVGKAVKAGRLIRPTACERCGDACKPEGHHPDYNRPLEVEWLCIACHSTERRKA